MYFEDSKEIRLAPISSFRDVIENDSGAAFDEFIPVG
jgi:hypothetical protein